MTGENKFLENTKYFVDSFDSISAIKANIIHAWEN
jgi:hypothetical protein